jgi:MFS family permease
MDKTNSQKSPLLKVLRLRDFRLLFSGSTVSMLGDQFTLIAMPWLVLQLTGDPLALGFVLALEGIPRAAFMLLGGAITDRFSARMILIVTDALRAFLTALIALAVFTGSIHIWMLYAFGLAFGLMAGFSVPARNSMVPLLVETEDLQAGNSVMMGVGELIGFVGPTIAGILIGSYSKSRLGIGLALSFDAFSFFVSVAALWLMRGGNRPESGQPGAGESVWASILAGIRYLWDDKALRVMFLIVTAVNFLFVGPLLVGIPVLANQRLPEGALAFGLLLSAYSGGNLGGFLLAGTLPRPTGKVMRVFLIALLAIFGLVLGALGFIYSTWLDFGLLLLLGLGNGYISIILFTWMQARTPREMLGRMMSMLMLSNTGLVPISQAISGAVSKWSLTGVFAAAGGLTLLVTLAAAGRPELIVFSESMAAGQLGESPAPAPEKELSA